MQKIIEPDLIRELSSLSHGHKLLYRILWEMADEVGMVWFDIASISDAAGIKYHDADFDAFGKRVVRFEAGHLFLPLYLSRHIKTFDVRNKGQSRIWRRLKERWGATPENMEPFYAKCREHDVFNLLPKFPDYHEDENGIKQWLVDYRQQLQNAAAVNTPHGWPEGVDLAFRAYMKMRIDRCMQITSKSDRNRNILNPENVLMLQASVSLLLQEGYSDFQITKAIIDASGNNWPKFTINGKPHNRKKPAGKA